MVKKILAALTASIISLISPAQAQNTVPGLGWSTNGTSVSSDQPFLMTSNQPGASQERALDVGTGLTKTDNGANSSFVIGLGPVLSYFYGTGATTNQALLNASHNLAGLAAGDIIYYDGANWSLIHKGANSTVFGVNGGGTVGYYSPSGSGTVTNFVASAGSWPAWLVPSVATATSTPTLSVAAGTGLTAYYVVGTDASGNVVLGALTASHIPNLDAAKITSGALAKAQQHASTVYKDAGNTYSGTATQDFSASGQTLLIPIKASSGTTGEINLNSTDLEFRSAGVTHKAAKQATTITAGTGLSGGGDLSTSRTLNISTVPLANGGSNADLSGASTGAVIYKGASALTSLAPVADKLVAFNSAGNGLTTVDPPTGGLYGDGADGAKTISTNTTETVPQIFRLTTLTIQTGCTWTVKSGTLILCTGAVDIQGTGKLVVANDIPGGVAAAAEYGPFTFYGGGPSPGSCPSASTGSSASGGGCGGKGGNGGWSTNGFTGAGGAAVYPSPGVTGSGGGTGHVNASSGNNGSGGTGAGSVGLYSGSTITIGASAKITANGGAGVAQSGTYGIAGGGGSGGVIDIGALTSITNSGTIEAKGGAGGNAVNSGNYGAGGGGGIVCLTAPSITAGTITLTGGAKGSGGAGYSGGADAQAGSTGVTYSTTAAPVKYRCF